VADDVAVLIPWEAELEAVMDGEQLSGEATVGQLIQQGGDGGEVGVSHFSDLLFSFSICIISLLVSNKMDF